MSEPKHADKAASAASISEEAAAAKARVRNAYETVRQAVLLQTHADGGGDMVAAAAVAANARLAMAAGGAYLLARLDPATPRALATAVRSFADVLQDIAMNALAGIANEDPLQAARLVEAELASARVAELCR